MKKLRIPEDDTDAFDILSDEKIIEKNLSKKLKEARGMRNILVHQYNSIDDGVVYHALTEELEKDVKKFIEAIKRIIF